MASPFPFRILTFPCEEVYAETSRVKQKVPPGIPAGEASDAITHQNPAQTTELPGLRKKSRRGGRDFKEFSFEESVVF